MCLKVVVGRDEAVIAAEVVAVEVLKVRLKVAANDRVRSRWVGASL